MNNFNLKNLIKNKGYSLIEVVVYIAVFSLISVVVVNSFIVSFSTSKTAFAKRNLLEAGNSAMETMTREIRGSESVVDANSTLGANPGILEINNSITSRTVKFQINSGSLDIYENTVLQGSISGSKVSISSLIFRKIITTSGEAVKIEMTLLDSLGRTVNFYNTVILRGSY